MKKKIVAILLCISVSLLSVPFSVSAETAEPQGSLDRAQAVSKLEALSNGKIELHNKDGQVFLSGKLSDEKTPSEESASQFLNENKSIFGLSNPATELKAGKGHKDENGDTFVDYTQQINGLEVYGHKLTVHFDNTGVIRSVSGDLEEDKTITALGNTPITGNDAIQAAEKQFTYKSLRETPTAEKLILNKDGKNYAVYKVNISSMEPQIINNDVFIEANSGKIVDIQSNLRYDGPAPGSGITVQGATVPLNLYLAGSTYVMYDSTRPGVTDGIVTRDLQHGETTGYPVTSLTGNYTDENSKASVSAHYNAGIVTDFYKNFYNRNSLDNALMEIDSFTHYKTNYNNAFWDGYEMIYGDGDGTRFTYLSGDLGIVGHEMTHAVINHTANLYYHNQSGALNESIADTFGVLIKTYNKYNVANGGNWTFNPSDWVIGEAVYTPGTPGDALRSLASPTICGQPDIMSNYQNLPDTEAGDYGGVHENSGIMNKAAYLLAQSVGMEKTAKIYYYALNHYMSMYTDFNGAQNCLYQAASDLYPTVPSVRAAVDNAFTAVGVNSVGSISMTVNPKQTSYLLGSILNLSGAEITVHYADGSAADMVVTPDMISGYDASKLGQQTIMVTYRGKTTSFIVNVFSSAKSVKIKSNPTKTTYFIGQTVDLSGAQITVTFNDDSTVDMPATQDMISYSYDANTPGQKYIVITYGGCLISFDVWFYNRVPANVILNPQMILDSPSSNANYYNQNIDISGWALNASGVSRVDIWLLDGGSGTRGLGSVSALTSRPDVVAAVDPKQYYIGSDKSGFGISIPSSSLSVGSHTIGAAAIGNDGSVQWTTRTISISKPGALMTLDSPSSNANYYNQNIDISGWALNASGVSRVDIWLLDGGSGTRGLGSVSDLASRPDVVAAVDPKHYYIGSDKSGFGISIPSSSLGVGSHTIGAAAIGNDGSVQWTTRTISIVKPEPVMTLDSPSSNANYYNQNIDINGWALNASGVSRVDIWLLDGGSGTRGLGSVSALTSRPDVVAAVDPKHYYIGSDKSGFGISIPSSSLGVGSHTIGAAAIGNDGSVQWTTQTISIVAPGPVMILDSPSSNANYYNQNIDISGWALNASGVSRVDIWLLDGGSGTRGLGSVSALTSRPDVAAAVDPKHYYIGSDKSGFGISIPSSSLGVGSHTIGAAAIGNDGSVQWTTRIINLRNVN